MVGMFFSKKIHIDTDITKIDKFLSRGVETIFPSKDYVRSQLQKGEQLTVYYGIDPTGPTIHIGHLIPIRKLAELQKLGHQVIFLIGDFTAMIGDPTDKSAVRKALTKEEVLHNLKVYKEQVSQFISFGGDNPALFKFNSEWLSKMSFKDVLDLASLMTVDQMLKRDMFKKRIEEEKPIYIHEFLYPLMQGYDSVAMNVDGEIGGNDQTFNMLTGRDLLKTLKNKEKFVITMKLLADPTGKKMGKSEGNMVSLNQTPADMFGKIMSWPDSMIIPSFEIITDVSEETISTIKQKLDGGENPKESKVLLAKEVVTMCFGKDQAEKAFTQFKETFSDGGIPQDIKEVSGEGKMIGDCLVEEKLVDSKSEARRLVLEGAIIHTDTNEKVTDINTPIKKGVYKIGKRRFIKII